MSEETITYEVDDGVAWVTINRPAARNALNAAAREGLFAATHRFNGDDSAKVMVLTDPDKRLTGHFRMLDLMMQGEGADAPVEIVGILPTSARATGPRQASASAAPSRRAASAVDAARASAASESAT